MELPSQVPNIVFEVQNPNENGHMPDLQLLNSVDKMQVIAISITYPQQVHVTYPSE